MALINIKPITPDTTQIVRQEVKQIAQVAAVATIKTELAIPAKPTGAQTDALEQGTTYGNIFSKQQCQPLFGLPVWDITTISLNGLSYTFSIAGVTVTQNRRIIRTGVNGVDGDIFEYISDGSYIINISADLISGVADVRPDEDINLVTSICQLKSSIGITNTILNNSFGVNNIVIENYVCTQSEVASRDHYKFEISAYSDNPLLYQIFIQQ